jgi:hypothetical protein
MLSHGEAAKKQSYEEQAKATLEGLAKLGLVCAPDPETVGEVAGIVKEIEGCCKTHEWSDKIGEMGDVPFFVKQAMTEYAHLLSQDDEHYAQSMRLQGKLREVLRSSAPTAKAKPKRK